MCTILMYNNIIVVKMFIRFEKNRKYIIVITFKYLSTSSRITIYRESVTTECFGSNVQY